MLTLEKIEVKINSSEIKKIKGSNSNSYVSIVQLSVSMTKNLPMLLDATERINFNNL